jgi:hypothetical protein
MFAEQLLFITLKTVLLNAYICLRARRTHMKDHQSKIKSESAEFLHLTTNHWQPVVVGRVDKSKGGLKHAVL